MIRAITNTEFQHYLVGPIWALVADVKRRLQGAEVEFTNNNCNSEHVDVPENGMAIDNHKAPIQDNDKLNNSTWA
ncbi:hypothetical protein CONPUDRAFT_160750 [Coniophora puteana RWD-64-598 SS2]|uniref:Uncharacterized protein n=1 Tax=Coniophora puteana (strain RWD-64-598) TaxID=741705 RepID=R7SDD3_CONPW|nr:uncharacterized protein CONPUDRAFT_160750 [Coniophora puteana RWD-64-598 SS2]EIW73757.1 hypothetical protein CONPUDRAFT_160750 [Coniophora puteana RWD-64-598 SS2]